MAGGGKGPIIDKVKLRGGGAIAGGTEVMAKPFDAIAEEVAFLGVEGDAIFAKDLADATKVAETKILASGPEEGVIDDGLCADKGRFDGGETGVEELGDFGVDNLHHGGEDGRGIAGSEGHNGVAVLLTVGAHEGKLLLVIEEDANLMVARFPLDADDLSDAA